MKKIFIFSLLLFQLSFVFGEKVPIKGVFKNSGAEEVGGQMVYHFVCKPDPTKVCMYVEVSPPPGHVLYNMNTANIGQVYPVGFNVAIEVNGLNVVTGTCQSVKREVFIENNQSLDKFSFNYAN